MLGNFFENATIILFIALKELFKPVFVSSRELERAYVTLPLCAIPALPLSKKRSRNVIFFLEQEYSIPYEFAFCVLSIVSIAQLLNADIFC